MAEMAVRTVLTSPLFSSVVLTSSPLVSSVVFTSSPLVSSVFFSRFLESGEFDLVIIADTDMLVSPACYSRGFHDIMNREGENYTRNEWGR